MPDKSTQNKTKNTMNNPVELSDTKSESKLKRNDLPQADALKERFKAGSIPLQSDFADVIDLANIGR